MICKKCGHQLEDYEKICPFCGEDTSTDESENIIFEECAKKMTDTEEDEAPIQTEKIGRRKRRAGRKTAKAEIAAEQALSYEKERNEKEKYNPTSLIVGIVVTLLLIGSAVFAGYFAYSHFVGESAGEYLKSILSLNEEINSANDGFASVLSSSSQELPTDELTAKISETNKSFNNIISTFKTIASPSMYSETNQKLGQAIELNKVIYQDILDILKNPIDTQTDQKLNVLSEKIDQCMSLYTSLGYDDISFSLPNETISIVSRLEPWITQKQAQYSQVISLIQDYTKYFDSMLGIFVKYDEANIDFNAVLKSVRNGTEQWASLFEQLEKAEGDLEKIQNEYKKLSVPSDLKSLNKGFSPILEKKLSYISKFRFAAQTERDFEKEKLEAEKITPAPGQETPETGLTPDQIAKKTQKINDLYQEAEKDNSAASKAYQKFASDLNTAKNNYLNPEFVLELKNNKQK